MIDILTGCYFGKHFPDNCEIELDLGCGKGRFLLALAQKYRKKKIIGADVMMGRLRKLERKVKRLGLSNVELLRVHAWDLIGYILPDGSLTRVHILNPDPWPKNRHAANRLLSSEFLGRLSRKIIENGVLHLSTDDRQYLGFIKRAITPLPCYTPDTAVINDIADLKTDFELIYEKLGQSVDHLAYRRVNHDPRTDIWEPRHRLA